MGLMALYTFSLSSVPTLSMKLRAVPQFSIDVAFIASSCGMGSCVTSVSGSQVLKSSSSDTSTDGRTTKDPSDD